MRFQPQDFQFEPRVRASFATQRIMDTIGARMTRVAAGEAEISLPFRADLSQQDGYVHAGVIATILDSRLRLRSLHADLARCKYADDRV